MVMGTPAYMAPEQARGEATDVRADVFALGGILCAILTGQPPFSGKSTLEVVQRAGAADLGEANARLARCEADAELLALCRRCLSPTPDDRPGDGRAVAEQMTAYLDGVQDRLRQAELAQAEARAKAAEETKRCRLTLALAAAVVVLLLGGGAFAFWRNQQVQASRERDVRNAEAVAALLNQGEEALKAGDTAKAAVALEAAKERFGEGGAEEQAQRLEQLDADLAQLRELIALDQFRWTLTDILPNPAVILARTREALRRFDPNAGKVSLDEAAALVTASAVREQIVSALDLLLVLEHRVRQRHHRSADPQKLARVRSLLRQVDTDPYRDAIRDAILAGDRAKLRELEGQKAALGQPPGFVAILGNLGASGVERQRQLLKAALRRWPGNLALLMTLGGTYWDFNRMETADERKETADERLRWFQAAVAAAPDNFAAHQNLGNALKDKGKVEEAIECYHKALALAPKHPAPLNSLGNALKGKGKVDEAIEYYRKAIALDPKYAIAHNNLGIALWAKGKVDEAIAEYRKAIALDSEYAKAHNNLGTALFVKGQVEEAIKCYQTAIELDSKYAKAHNGLGNALLGKGQVEEAIKCYKKAIELDPKEAIAHNNLGNALRRKGKVDEAIKYYQTAIDLDPKYANPHFSLGLALAGKGNLDGAIACWKKATALDPKLTTAHFNLGNALYGKGKAEEAIACWKKAIALDPKLTQAHNNLGSALYDKGLALAGKGKVEEAIACFREVIALKPKQPEGHVNLGILLLETRQTDEAIKVLQKAAVLNPKLATTHHVLGDALIRVGRHDEARQSLQRAWTLFPKQHLARDELSRQIRSCARYKQLEPRLPQLITGEEKPASAKEAQDAAKMCWYRNLTYAATRLRAAAFAIDPKTADDLKASHRYSAACEAALTAAGQGKDAGDLDDKERARLRQQALDWLRADLAAWEKRLNSGQGADRAEVEQKLKDWQADRNLAGIRDKDALAKLPEAERKALEKVWADVAMLLNKAETPAKTKEKE
jgi:tetratricopeptide (TPR) repeat protein